jgi:hypothetical protein
VQKLLIVILIEGESMAAVRAGDDEDAVAAHLAQLGDITEEALRTQMTTDAFDGRGSRE